MIFGSRLVGELGPLGEPGIREPAGIFSRKRKPRDVRDTVDPERPCTVQPSGCNRPEAGSRSGGNHHRRANFPDQTEYSKCHFEESSFRPDVPVRDRVKLGVRNVRSKVRVHRCINDSKPFPRRPEPQELNPVPATRGNRQYRSVQRSSSYSLHTLTHSPRRSQTAFHCSAPSRAVFRKRLPAARASRRDQAHVASMTTA